jgi:ubiquinone biosynthesis protein
MIFRHGFFHADPHPSNIMVLEEPRKIGLIDFGTAGQLARDDTSKLTGLFVDVMNQNIEALPRRLAALGVGYPREKEDELVAELQDLFYRYYGARLSEIDPIQVIREAFGLIYRMQLRLPTRFVLLDRAVATLGSVGIELYPDFNVFEVAKPYARDLMLERFSPQRIATRTQQEARAYAGILAELPYQLHDVLQEVRDGQVEVGFRHEGLDILIRRMDVVFNRIGIAITAVGGAITSAILAFVADDVTSFFGILSAIGLVLSSLLSIWLVWGVLRSGRL